jgi:hypothetical protein
MPNKALFTIAGVAVLLAALAACRSVSGGGGSGTPMSETPSTSKVTPPAVPLVSGPSGVRSRAAADVVKGTVLRVDGVALATPGSRLAGYLIRPGTERPLSSELLNELVTLVRSESGFDDSIVKRCRPGTSVGFRLFRKPAPDSGSTNGPVTELVLDFGCQKLTVAEAGAAGNPHATYFDPSRAAFVAFVNRALPDDGELSKLRQPAPGRGRQGK